MAISPLEALATEVQLLEAGAVERLAENHLRLHPSDPVFEVGTGFGGREKDVSIILRIVAKRFRRLDWHVTVDIEAKRLIFNDATPEF